MSHALLGPRPASDIRPGDLLPEFACRVLEAGCDWRRGRVVLVLERESGVQITVDCAADDAIRVARSAERAA